jgi:hemolysin activation/secretion protein
MRAAIDARSHQFLGAFTQWESRLRAVTAAGSIPDVELPSFGGDGSVRGYRPDAGLALTVWALQNEVWFPVRLGLGLPEGIDTILRRNVAVAVFGDVGGLHESRDSFSGVKGSAGIGLRLVWQDFLTIRLDYAHAIGDQSRTKSSGLFYFTVTTRPTF